MNGVGLCAVFSRQGDWAFDYALKLARHHKTKLNVFHFLESPYMLRRDVVFVDADKTETAQVTPELISKRDREMREMYDPRLGDYVEVGFRLCEGNDEFELRKCFKKGEYEVLVIGYNSKGVGFGGSTTIEAFAEKFKGPVVLVGPNAPDAYHINKPAEDRLSDLLIPDGKWQKI
ncbi:MAG: universal stress protein [Pseudomonadota bacterium]